MKIENAVKWLAHPVILCAGWYVIRGYLLEDPYNTLSYRYAFYCFLGVVVLMESRVLVGKRGKRDTLFYIHLFSGVCVLVLLGIVGFLHTSYMLEIPTVLFAALTVTTGIFLLHRAS